MELNIELYKKMYLIRRAEDKIRESYLEDEMKTPMHMSTGSEAIAAGVCQALSPLDQIIGTFRSHAIYLAKTMESDQFFAELYGRVTGMAKGKSGSMHLTSADFGLICTSAIVGSNIPVSLGAAFSNKQNGNGKVVVVFFGDGAIDEGVFWESINSACQMKLPVLFVCEDNDYAIHTHRHLRHGYESIKQVVDNFNIHTSHANTTDPEEIYNITDNILSLMRESGQPGFIHLNYCRYLEHVGVSEDFNKGYRDLDEIQKWMEKDPVDLQRKKILKMISEKELLSLEKKIDTQVDNSIQLAKIAPFPDTSELMRDVLV
jgi:TPP-dependent pyruvate/acetoin dehydrogenase alpha subunit